MQKVRLTTGEVVEVENNDAHRLIDQEGAQLVRPNEVPHSNRMMSANQVKGGKHDAHRQRPYNSR